MKANAKPVKLTIDGKEISVEDSLTILEAAQQNGISIPTLCHHPALSNWGGCRLCVVEVDKSPKLAASCVMPVRNGMEVVTRNEAITASRRLSLELLFAERNHNCMFCPQSGDCELQQMAYDLQMDHLTVSQTFQEFPTDTTGEYMTIDHNRCILCGRCVRACQEIAGSYVLGFHNRGPKTLIGFDLLTTRAASGCVNCGACLQVCPTGAISSRYRSHYAVKGQPSARQPITTFCAGCALLCPTRTVVGDQQILKVEGIMAAADSRPDRGQLCYRGRFEILKDYGRRLTAPMVKDQRGQWQVQDWEQALDQVSAHLGAIQQKEGSQALFGLTSSRVTHEALVLFKELMTRGWPAGLIDTLDGDYFRALNAAGDWTTAESSWKKIAAADMVLLAGADIGQSHPLLMSLLRRACIEKHLTVGAVGEMSQAPLYTTHYLPVSGQKLAQALEILATLAGTGAGLVPKDVDDASLAALECIARAFTVASKPFILAGQELVGPHAGAALGAILRLADAKRSHTGESAAVTFLKSGGNSMAAWRLGLAAQQIPDGRRSAGLLLLGDEQEPAIGAWAQKLQTPDFLAVITPYFHPGLAQKAHVLLPGALWREEDGTFSGMDGKDPVFKLKVLDPPQGARCTWDILQALALRAGARMYAQTWEAIRNESGRTAGDPLDSITR